MVWDAKIDNDNDINEMIKKSPLYKKLITKTTSYSNSNAKVVCIQL